jgi:hypothetical protein
MSKREKNQIFSYQDGVECAEQSQHLIIPWNNKVKKKKSRRTGCYDKRFLHC